MSHIHIDVEHVSFGYDKNHRVLEDICLHAGETDSIGLVGANGVGTVSYTHLTLPTTARV